MSDDETAARHYAIVARAIAFIRAHARSQPGLDEVAAAVHLSPAHLQRVFAEWAGISPKRFLQYLTKEYARQQLAQSASLLDVTLAAGLGSPSRLHDLMVSCEAMTPGEIRPPRTASTSATASRRRPSATPWWRGPRAACATSPSARQTTRHCSPNCAACGPPPRSTATTRTPTP